MIRLIDITRANYATYYDARTGKATLYPARLCLFALIAWGFAYLGFFPDDELLGYIITTVTVLIGFSFSVLIYLVSQSETSQSDTSLEAENRLKIRSKISMELVDNVSFFNLLALSELIVSIVLATFPNRDTSIGSLVLEKIGKTTELIAWTEYIDSAVSWLIAALVFVFILLILEGLYSFQRLTRRVNFLFTRS